ncbi:DUF1254 domain-containing protein [Phenylobacterium sp. SCN 70-31]|uniref:DUF1254 domain-containing protein n=1 Tax=Phenylobacterium sp. SCN 70-31 TaxID=1660129 RepID=UPI00086B2FED|nr:DUF1254 domain-containing protein [Phenylobacterium sp. SCN 70-31]ODT86144.1 MAG: hypothetical protein ABS78_17600 [Phenylobacterium sp. SCN 70-31]
MRTVVVFLATAVVVGLLVHAGLLWAAPRWATDRQIEAGLARGAVWNRLQHSPPPRAGTTSVPLANPDSLTSRAYLDLSKGPLVLEGPLPKACVYWSASLFAHDTRTVFIASDRDYPEGHVRIGFRHAGQSPVSDAQDVPSPSRVAVLLIRCFMRDRTDAAYVEALDPARRALVLEPAA